jgi:hypothetical protein
MGQYEQPKPVSEADLHFAALKGSFVRIADLRSPQATVLPNQIGQMAAKSPLYRCSAMPRMAAIHNWPANWLNRRHANT